jgi:hypothetical protein
MINGHHTVQQKNNFIFTLPRQIKQGKRKKTNYNNIINDSSDLQGYKCDTADKNSCMPETALVAPIGSLVTQPKEA